MNSTIALPKINNYQYLPEGSTSHESSLTTGSQAKPSRYAANQTPSSDTIALDQNDSDTNLISYGATMHKTTIAAQMQEVRSRVFQESTEDGSTKAYAETQQLTFSFFAETRSEELAVFQQRTQNTASQLADNQQQDAFQFASQQIAMRFELNLEISGAALNGVANAAESLASSGSQSFADFQEWLDNTLSQTDAIMNRLLELMNDFFSNTSDDFASRIQQLYSGLEDIGLLAGGDSVSSSGVSMQSININIQMEFEFTSVDAQVQQSDPIVFDLNGNGIQLTRHDNGASFDILGNGKKTSTAFVNGGDAFLALDRNGNGLIDSGRELFGDQNGAANGFEELRKLDSNADGVINANDTDYASLRLWKDNGNGVTEKGELISLQEAGIKEICLNYSNVNRSASGGNRITQIASFLRNDGSRGLAADAMLNYLA